MANLVWLNGQFLPMDSARVSVLDRGFLFGDGVYEVIPVYGGRLFRLREHLQRLRNSMHEIHMQLELSDQQWRDILQVLVEQHPGHDQSVYLQVTRGADDHRDHAIPEDLQPTVFCMATPLKPELARQLAAGISAVTLDDIRWERCDIKAITLLANVLLKREATRRGAHEAILVRDGHAMEGSASNLFVVHSDTLITPPKSHLLLPGITRDLILELAQQRAVPWQEAAVPLDTLHSAEEVWLTSSTREIMPVINLDGAAVGNGQPGPLWAEMSDYYRQYKADFVSGTTTDEVA